MLEVSRLRVLTRGRVILHKDGYRLMRIDLATKDYASIYSFSLWWRPL